jgi:2-polyprenyl-6-methoxyphenol hydroxylase-like FAD-dependent oxidoreductase
MNEIARSKRIKNVVSLQARERRRQPRGDSNRHVSKGLLERLEAENAQLRDSVVELVLQIQALRDALGRPRSEL